jgi:hypothetical protein
VGCQCAASVGKNGGGKLSMGSDWKSNGHLPPSLIFFGAALTSEARLWYPRVRFVDLDLAWHPAARVQVVKGRALVAFVPFLAFKTPFVLTRTFP